LPKYAMGRLRTLDLLDDQAITGPKFTAIAPVATAVAPQQGKEGAARQAVFFRLAGENLLRGRLRFSYANLARFARLFLGLRIRDATRLLCRQSRAGHDKTNHQHRTERGESSHEYYSL